jgi:type VI secretion system protein
MLPLVVQIEEIDRHHATTHAYVHSPVRIGRNPLNDVVLNLPYISQWHALVRIDEEKTYYIDLGATNPTVVNGKPLAKHEEIEVDDTIDIRVGNLRFHFLRAPAPRELIRPTRRESAFSLPTPGSLAPVDPTQFLDRGSDRPAARAADLNPSLTPRRAPQAPPPKVLSDRPAPPTAEPPAAVSVRERTVLKSARPAAPPRAQKSAVAAGEMGVADRPGPSAGPRPARQPADDPFFNEQMRAVFERLDVYQKAYQFALSNLGQQIERETSAIPLSLRTRFSAALSERYPDSALPQGVCPSAQSPRGAEFAGGVPELENWFRRLTNGLFSPAPTPRNLTLAMERAGAVLEIFSQAFIELRKTQAQFSQEMGLQLVKEDSLLHHTEDPRAILAYLLDPSKDGSTRIEELSRVFAEFALHHVALIKATVEGGRSLMKRISPESIDSDPALQGEDTDDDRLLTRVFPYQARRLWKRYTALYQMLSEEDRFTKELFGRAFARAYYTFSGGRISKPSSY